MKGKKNHPELEVEKLVPVLTYLPQDQHEDLKRLALIPDMTDAQSIF